MRIPVLILPACLALASCHTPKAEGQKTIAPRAVPTAEKANSPTGASTEGKAAMANPHAANPHAGVTAAEGAPQGGNPGMGFMPDYTEGGEGMGVTDVRPDGAAAKAGILAGDIIVKFGGIPIGDVHEYMAALGTVKVGDPVEIVVKRGKETKTLKGTVGVSNR